MTKLERPVAAVIFTAFLLIVWQKKLYSNLNESLMMIRNLEKIWLKMTKLEWPRQRTDRRTDGQAQNSRDNVLFASLLIGLSVDFLRWWHVHVRVVCARVCVCVRETVRAFVCVCYCQDAVTKIYKPIFVNIQPS